MATRIAEAAPAEGKSTWSIDSARSLYNIEGWGAGFFDINNEGHVIVRPDKDRPDHVVDLFAITNDWRSRASRSRCCSASRTSCGRGSRR